MRAVLFAFVVVPVVVFPVAIVAQAVLDLNFIGLAEAVQASKKSACCYSIDNKALQPSVVVDYLNDNIQLYIVSV